MIGTFLATITDHVLKEVGDKNTPAVSITLETIENVQTREAAIQTVYWSGWLTDAAFDFTMKTLTETLGWNGENLSDLNGTGKYLGVEVWAVLEEQAYEGKLQTRVKFLNKVGGKVQKPFDKEKATALSERLKGRVLAFRKNQKAEPVDDGLKF